MGQDLGWEPRGPVVYRDRVYALSGEVSLSWEMNGNIAVLVMSGVCPPTPVAEIIFESRSSGARARSVTVHLAVLDVHGSTNKQMLEDVARAVRHILAGKYGIER